MDCLAAASSDVGRCRSHNEDSYLVDDALQLYVVADGMGGHACGEVASGMAVDAFRDFVDEQSDLVWGFRDASPSVEATAVTVLLRDAMRAACSEVFRSSQADPERRGMGTTCTALLVAGERAFVAHVGDSRCYLVRDGNAVQLTRDHSVLNELLRRGQVTPQAAAAPQFAGFRNALVRAVGVCADVEVDVVDLELLPGDTFVLGSDGLTQYVEEAEIPGVLAGELGAATRRFVDLANERGGSDNITVLAVRVPDLAPVPQVIDRREEFARKIGAFRDVPLFRRLAYGEMIRVLSSTHVRTFDAGEVVLREGEPGDALFVLLSGRVEVAQGGVTVAELRAGSHFGEISLVDGAPRSATVTVREPSRVVRLLRAHLTALIEREPEIGVKLLWSMAEALGERLRATTSDLTETRTETGPRPGDTPAASAHSTAHSTAHSAAESDA